MELTAEFKTLLYSFSQQEIDELKNNLISIHEQNSLPLIKYRTHYKQPFNYFSFTKHHLNDYDLSGLNRSTGFSLKKKAKKELFEYVLTYAMNGKFENFDESKYKEFLAFLESFSNLKKDSSTTIYFTQYTTFISCGGSVSWLYKASPVCKQSKPRPKDNILMLDEEGRKINRIDLKNIMKLPNIEADCLSHKSRKRNDLKNEATEYLKPYISEVFRLQDIIESTYVYEVKKGLDILHEIESNLNNPNYYRLLARLNWYYDCGAYDFIFKKICKFETKTQFSKQFNKEFLSWKIAQDLFATPKQLSEFTKYPEEQLPRVLAEFYKFVEPLPPKPKKIKEQIDTTELQQTATE